MLMGQDFLALLNDVSFLTPVVVYRCSSVDGSGRDLRNTF